MSRTVELSDVAERTRSREDGRVAARALPGGEPFDLDLDREPSLSFLDGLVQELRRRELLEGVTFVFRSALVGRHLGRFVAHDPTLRLWTRDSAGNRSRIEPPDDPPVVTEEGPIADDAGLI